MAHRRRLTKKECEALQAESRLEDGEPVCTLKGFRIIANVLIENGDATMERCMEVMQICDAQLTKKTTLIPCSFCGKKFGIFQCSGCSRSDDIRYCSPDCQKAGWSVHKTTCRSKQLRAAE